MRKMMACMLGAALCFSMAGAETGVSSAEKASSPFGRMIWNRGWEFRLEDEPGKSGWQTVHLPHTFSLPYFMSDSFYTGLGSYRTVCRTVTFLTIPVSFFTSVKIRTFPRAAVTSGV